MQDEGIHPYALLGYIAAALALIAFAYVFFTLVERQEQENVMLPTGFPPHAPAPTVADRVENQQGFQHAVRYTADGFRPSAIQIREGERVRITNTSNAVVEMDGVGLLPGAYVEYGYSETGEVIVTAANHSLTIQVE